MRGEVQAFDSSLAQTPGRRTSLARAGLMPGSSHHSNTDAEAALKTPPNSIPMDSIGSGASLWNPHEPSAFSCAADHLRFLTKQDKYPANR